MLQQIHKDQTINADKVTSYRTFSKAYFYVGQMLLLAFTFQQVNQWHLPWLTGWQFNNIYKQLSGLVLVLFLWHQWHCSLARRGASTPKTSELLIRHKWVGSLAPLFFYAHSQQLGYGYLQALSLTFFGIFITGVCNFEITRINKNWFRTVWLTVHIGLATCFLCLLAYHIYTTYAY